MEFTACQSAFYALYTSSLAGCSYNEFVLSARFRKYRQDIGEITTGRVVASLVDGPRLGKYPRDSHHVGSYTACDAQFAASYAWELHV